MLEIVSTSVFYEVAALLVLAAGVGLIGVLLRQPLIVSFIAVGILAGPSVFGLAQSEEHIGLLAELGISILLFLVGLKLDIRLVRTLGLVALMTGLGQVAFTSIIGFGIGLALGFDITTSLYVAVALTFSSTIIIVKLLSDKREIDSLHGRIALGFLIVQDLVVVLAMIVLSAIGVGTQSNTAAGDILLIFLSGIAMLVVVGIFIRYIAEPLVERLARAPELLVCFAIGWAALFAAAGDFLGFSMELGGLLSGVSLASTRLREAMAARLAPLRDFLLLFFFIALGTHLDLSIVGEQAPAAIIFSMFVLIGNPLIVLAIMGAMGYRKRTGFLAGLTVAQISEFSLIFMAMGVSLGHVGTDSLGLVTLVGIITISLSTYMIMNSHWLYGWLDPLLSPFERAGTPREADEQEMPDKVQYDVLLFGLGRYGGAIAQRLRARGLRVLGIDFNPVAVRRWQEEDFEVIYGDASDPEFIANLKLSGVTWAISAVPESETGITGDDSRVALIHALREQDFQGKIAVTSHRDEEWEHLRSNGANLILEPFQDAADQAADLLTGSRHPPRFEVIEPQDQKELS
ncbi:cation:proton antiporter [Hoeflea prorocentri]|uniref:Cation:proton antiporter n=1 Tax=Hoeflea prorocentri TaxID=1922333 RepID=A0A9X3UKE4_9HYPH|nr:cation:proton antiporter family protein [Hoeflea prorocentri]MCY6380764.1 cation:proton antiporter [Hoeflea prorocentri]MDA5398564.1 cation:proton antiporter [Hoeflea prorocentri]